MDFPALCEHVRTRCTRAQPVQDMFFREFQVMLCPTWTEKDNLAGRGVFPLHVDEALLLATEPGLTKEDKAIIGDLMLRFPGIRLLEVRDQ